MMQFGQFLDHDLTLLALSTASNGIRIRCCGSDLDQNPDKRHPECFQIPIPRNDPFFSRFNEDCMEFVRSAAAPPSDCKLGPRNQINQLTAFIDASMVYGSTEEEANELRDFTDGLLKVTNFGNRKLLPLDKENVEECNRQRTDQFCFKAGDERVNEQIDLAAFHIVFLREHNRIVKALKGYNPHWNDEKLYQEGRKIVGAQFQHMVYNEFLPLLLGYQVMKIFNILPTRSGYSNTYDRNLNPSIFNGFATAAYRYGHTLVQDKFNIVGADGRKKGALPLSDTFNTPFKLFENGVLDGLLRGLTSQPSQNFDSFVTPQLTNLLFKHPGEQFGLDLVALNIQRGRDHGLPSYNTYREVCGMKRINSFSELDNIMRPGSANKIRAAGYRCSIHRGYGMSARCLRDIPYISNVDDIDVFIAGISEKPFPGSILGPTFACLTGGQFARQKHGDRFFYENGGQNQVFTPAQLAQIRNSNLARILCNNGDNIRFMQPIPLLQSGVWNSRTSCQSLRIPTIDLSAWRESRPTTDYVSEEDDIDDQYKNIKWG
ncbi:Chorion peroxidase [Nymphon striatum]|nr:Chorion peroxidase [Nymphon striatum]